MRIKKKLPRFRKNVGVFSDFLPRFFAKVLCFIGNLRSISHHQIESKLHSSPYFFTYFQNRSAKKTMSFAMERINIPFARVWKLRIFALRSGDCTSYFNTKLLDLWESSKEKAPFSFCIDGFGLLFNIESTETQLYIWIYFFTAKFFVVLNILCMFAGDKSHLVWEGYFSS